MRNKIALATSIFAVLASCIFWYVARSKNTTIYITENKEVKKNIMERKMKVEIWSDVMCPFCYIGKRNFEKALSQFEHNDQVEIEWKSFQLDPTMPEVPKYQDDLYMFVADRKGLTYDQSKAMHRNLIQYAKSVGLEYNLEQTRVTNSLKTHRIIQFAKTKGWGDKAEERFFYAYFTQGKNLNDKATLIELGKEIGLTEAEINLALTDPIYIRKIENEVREAQSLGARGVPFFVVDRKFAIAGAQQPAEFANVLKSAFENWQKETRIDVMEGKSCNLDGDCK